MLILLVALIAVNVIVLGSLGSFVLRTKEKYEAIHQLLVAISSQIDMVESVAMRARHMHAINQGHLKKMYYVLTKEVLEDEMPTTETKGN